MDKQRFQHLASIFVFLIAAQMVTGKLIDKTDQGFATTYGGINAPTCGEKATQRSKTRFKAGTGAYIAAQLKHMSTYTEMVDSDLKKKEGVTDLAYTLPDDKLVLFDRLVIEHASAAANTAVDQVTGWSKDLPEEIINGSIEIKTGSEVVFEGRLHQLKNYQYNTEEGYFELIEGRYLLPGQTFQVTIKQQKAFTDDANDHYLRVNFDGLTTYIS